MFTVYSYYIGTNSMNWVYLSDWVFKLAKHVLLYTSHVAMRNNHSFIKKSVVLKSENITTKPLPDEIKPLQRAAAIRPAPMNPTFILNFLLKASENALKCSCEWLWMEMFYINVFVCEMTCVCEGLWSDTDIDLDWSAVSWITWCDGGSVLTIWGHLFTSHWAHVTSWHCPTTAGRLETQESGQTGLS